MLKKSLLYIQIKPYSNLTQFAYPLSLFLVLYANINTVILQRPVLILIIKLIRIKSGFSMF